MLWGLLSQRRVASSPGMLLRAKIAYVLPSERLSCPNPVRQMHASVARFRESIAPARAAGTKWLGGHQLPLARKAFAHQGFGRSLSTARQILPSSMRIRIPRVAEKQADPMYDFSNNIGPLACHLLKDNFGARQTRKRVGRGPGSGRGKRCGRGQKGKKSRAGNHGYLKISGGNTPMWKLVPKRGFYKPKREFCLLNVGDLREALTCGRLSLPTDGPLTVRHLFESRLITIRGRHAGVKLLARGHEVFDFPINIEVQDASKRAIEAVEKAGGKITTVFYTRLTLRGLLKPEKFAKKKRLLPRPALPPPKLRKRYLDPDRRGYLADLEIGDVIRPHEQPPHVLLPEKYRKTQDAAGNDGETQA